VLIFSPSSCPSSLGFRFAGSIQPPGKSSSVPASSSDEK
jgi:hypothetical protein